MSISSPEKLNPKAAPPVLNKDTVIRQHLFSKLDDGLQKRLALVSAPAGYGKTSLITTWVNQRQLPIAWFSLDDTDNTPSHFFSYLFLAIQNGAPDVEFDFENFSSVDGEMGETALFSLIKTLQEDVPGMILVLDDYQVVTHPVIHRFVQQLIQSRRKHEQPTRTSISGLFPVIITRADPPFPLQRWRIQGELLEIRASDLVFSAPEGKSFFELSSGMELTEPQIQSVLALTEGWIAGMQLAAISFHEHYRDDAEQFMREFNGCNPLVADYFMSEVIASLPENIQQFLVCTSILERMSGPLCNAVRSAQDSQEILEYLEKSHLFVINLDHERTWFRYHHLLADYVKKRANQMDRSEICDRHLLAAQWFEQHEFYEEGIGHYISAGRIDEAVRMICHLAPTLLQKGNSKYLNKLLDLFAPDDFGRYPWLSIFRGWTQVLLETGFEEYWLEQAARGLVSANADGHTRLDQHNEMAGHFLAIRAMSAAKRGDSAGFEGLLAGVDQSAFEERRVINGMICYARGILSFGRGDFTQSGTALQMARVDLLAGGQIAALAEVIGLLGEIDYIQGELKSAANLFTEAISLQRIVEHVPSLYRSYSCLGHVLFEWNQTDEAIAQMIRGYYFSKGTSISAQVYSGSVLAGAYIELCEMDNAREIIEELDGLPFYRENIPFTTSLWNSCKLRFYCANRDLRKAQKLVDDRGMARIDGSIRNRDPERMALIRYFLNIDEPDKAIELSERMIAEISQSKRTGKHIRLLVNQAVAYGVQGVHDRAMELIIAALELGRTEGYIRRFIDYDYTILPFLVEISGMEPGQLPESFDMDYLKEILLVSYEQNAFIDPDGVLLDKGKPEKIGSALPIVDNPLTRQEERILQLIISGQDNFQIAAIQHITINTVKSHISHIFSKLGVHNRVQATNQARKLGLLR